ncbi:NAD(P)H nitroreductase [Alteromonas facilis]|uniref:NAD(P)H nitroreductase n=1 Tax=Alteromonas facilis TaxID=2048004 RepID=UPI000C2858C6|nr:NAD(P)H nitroreductase [Alteromonas facilis]
MNAIKLLINRQSLPRLQAPAPQGEELEIIKQAALRAPDHGCLTPWQFIIFEGDARNALGEIFEASAIERGEDQKTIERAPELPLRAPMIIVAATSATEHPKVPFIEQVQSAGCAVQAMQMAAVAQGFAGIWRTGSYAQCDYVKRSLGISEDDELVGFLYLGTAACEGKGPPKRASDTFFRHWPFDN